MRYNTLPAHSKARCICRLHPILIHDIHYPIRKARYNAEIKNEIRNRLHLPAVRYVSLFISSGIGAVNSIIFSVTGCVKRTKQQCRA